MVDVVVVGGGAAGCVVAARLAERETRSVLLLEAGHGRRADFPAELRDGWSLPRPPDWGFVSEPDGRGAVEELRRTKLLGGTSWLTRFTPRGSPSDYDAWEARGNPGWGFEDVLPYLVRLEADLEFGDESWHGDVGPIPSTRYPSYELADVTAAAFDAMRVAGFPAVEDHNRPGAVGAGRMPMNSRAGARVTTADAYLPSDWTPPNLTIRCDAEVSHVIFDRSRASGVQLVDGTTVEAGWVVLCAGVFGSPVLLMHSGIGPFEELRSVGAPTRVDLSGVGANLAEHPAVDVISVPCASPARAAPVLHIIATFHSSSSSEADPPDLMLWASDPEGDPATFEVAAVLLKPQGRGRVRLRSIDPRERPAIELAGLRHPSDMDRLVECAHRGEEVARHPAVARYLAQGSVHAATAPETRERVLAESYPIPHFVGTCAMGTRPDDGAVVDPIGRVHGTDGLTVADASIMPDVPSGFTHIPTIMIAERLSDILAGTV